MKKRYKIVLNVEIEDPKKPYPSGGDYAHKDRIEGLVYSILAHGYNWPQYSVKVTLDKLIDKGEIA